MKDPTRKEVERAVQEVLSRKTKPMLRKSIEADVKHKNSLKTRNNKQNLLRALKRVQDRDQEKQQRRDHLYTYLIMKNSDLCKRNPQCPSGNGLEKNIND